MSQTGLYDKPPRRRPRHYRAFLAFHRENPDVYRLFMRFARQVKGAGYERYSSDAICHRIRWHVNIDTKSGDGFKMNDHYTAHYARLLMEDYPDEFGGLFELRRYE